MPEQGYVISDLHLGAGAADALEHFRDDEVFVDWVESITDPGATLIINGDFVDFLRIAPLSVAGRPSHLLWDEDTSLIKLDTAVLAHAGCFDALARFIELGGKLRLTIGNHDFDLAWPRLQQRFREAVRDSKGSVVFIVGADNYAGVHIEHGYQFTPENCPSDPNHFIHEVVEADRSRQYLERVWGTDFVLRFFTEIERTNPYIDKVKPTILVARLALKNGWIPRRAFVDLVVFLRRRGIPWKAIASAVLADGDVQPWDLVHAFSEPDWQELAQDIVREHDNEIADAIANLTPEDRHALVHGATINIGADVDLLNDDGETLGLFRDDREVRAAKDRLRSRNVTHVVFGHTHEIIDGALDGALFNPGTWIAHLNLKSEYMKAKLRDHPVTFDLLNDRALYVVKRRAVVIRPDQYRARVELIDCT